MLKELYIKNVAVIEEVRIDFRKGFNVLTGETGAGKSILIDSINMALGGKAGKELVRTGCERAAVNACFSSNEAVNNYLEECGIETDDDVILTRQLSAESKSSARINGMTVTSAVLREVGRLLCDIHGQNDNHFLLSNRYHISYLDSYAKLDDLKTSYEEAYTKLKRVSEKINSLSKDEAEKQRRAEMLQFQINDIDSAKLKKGELSSIEERLTFLSNIEKILSEASTAHSALYSAEDNAYDLLNRSSKALSEAAQYDSKLSEASRRLESALIEIEDISGELGSYIGRVDFDEGEFNELNERMELINSLKRKYGATEEEILAYRDKLYAELSELQGSEEMLDKLLKEEAQLRKSAEDTASILSARRTEAAERLSKEIMEELKELDMPKVVFSVRVTQKCDDNGQFRLHSNGFDEVEFLISANPGEELKPLAKIASGGELSRIMLALKSVFADTDDAETLIFDEIDTGVSGRAAQKIAEKLSRLSLKKQVFSITHLAQLASMADAHYLIHKTSDESSTVTSVKLLSKEERIGELARIIGGAYITELTVSNASEMLSMAEKQRSAFK